jgi:UDP-N-acetylglucosamine--N-acetylmuramyl-(pentapeptide) pyrophosphoryl-undecaprenol N-acetylglucosamine transferase
MTMLFAGGGTGGHLYPAVAIADAVRRLLPDTRIVFVGNRDRIEGRVAPTLGYEFIASPVRGLRRALTAANLAVPFRLVAALVQSFRLLRSLRPAVVVGTGGYVAGPPLYVASLLGIPTLIQEQNSYPGIATRLLARRAREVHICFEETRRHLRRRENVHVSGNPIRAAIGSVPRAEGARRYGFDPARPTILVTGGSLGAARLNAAVLAAVRGWVAEDGVQLLWLTGEAHAATIRAQLAALGLPAGAPVRVEAFEPAMEHAYAASDLAIARSGASTLAELAAAGVPAVLVPYPFAAADHQTRNADTMVHEGAAVLLRENDAASQLLETVRQLMRDPARRASMAERMRALARPDAAATIARAVLRLGQDTHD